ncbi:hypothetical protein G6F57_016907 [Rhizopus arrhizus]|nr:hypothetical protein G6F57_016907 [Rhizopus arrhizus]
MNIILDSSRQARRRGTGKIGPLRQTHGRPGKPAGAGTAPRYLNTLRTKRSGASPPSRASLADRAQPRMSRPAPAPTATTAPRSWPGQRPAARPGCRAACRAKRGPRCGAVRAPGR